MTWAKIRSRVSRTQRYWVIAYKASHGGRLIGLKSFVCFCVRLSVSQKSLLAFALGGALAVALTVSAAYAAPQGVEGGSPTPAVSKPSASQSQEEGDSLNTTATLDAARN